MSQSKIQIHKTRLAAIFARWETDDSELQTINNLFADKKTTTTGTQPHLYDDSKDFHKFY